MFLYDAKLIRYEYFGRPHLKVVSYRFKKLSKDASCYSTSRGTYMKPFRARLVRYTFGNADVIVVINYITLKI